MSYSGTVSALRLVFCIVRASNCSLRFCGIAWQLARRERGASDVNKHGNFLVQLRAGTGPLWSVWLIPWLSLGGCLADQPCRAFSPTCWSSVGFHLSCHNLSCCCIFVTGSEMHLLNVILSNEERLYGDTQPESSSVGHDHTEHFSRCKCQDWDSCSSYF